MITEDYVSFETAKLLKEKGFQQLQDNCGYFTTEMIYSINVDDNGEHHFAHQYPAGVYNKDKYIAAPTIQMAMKWLREEHKLHIWIAHKLKQNKGLPWYYEIHNIETGTVVKIGDVVCGSYEVACEAAIRYCLENLI